MKNKKLIFNSDDFGHSHPFNMGVFKGIQSGVLKTSCVLANMEGYSEAVSLKSDLENIKFGVHLNLFEGKSITGANFLTDCHGEFDNGYVEILRKSANKDFLSQIEYEYRAQIERILGDFEINHINSHVHIHSIPNIFKLVCKLALEYNIPYVRTQFEKPYFSKWILPVNIVKQKVLNCFSVQNKKNLPEKLFTNDYLIGVQYTGNMDKRALLSGLEVIDEGVVEALIHPAYYEDKILRPKNYNEFLMTQDVYILDEIKALGFDLCDCSKELLKAGV